MKIILAFLLAFFFTQAHAFLRRGFTQSCIQGVTQPSVAAVAGYNCLVFYDDFSSWATIDTHITDNPGYNWYPAGILGAGDEPSSDYTVSGSGLSINTQPTPGGAPGLHTIAPLSSTNYVGHTFQAPFYIEYKIATNQMTAPGVRGYAPCSVGGAPVARYGWPNVWMEDATMLLAKTYQRTISGNYAEIDGPYEFYVGCKGEAFGTWSPQASVHYWTNWNVYNAGCINSIKPSGTWNDTTFHVTGELVKTVAQGGGIG